MDTRYHFILDCIAKKEVELNYLKTEDQAAYIFTEPLKFEVFKKLCANIGLKMRFTN